MSRPHEKKTNIWRAVRSARFFLIAFCLLIAVFFTASDCFAQKIVDVSAQVKVAKSGLVFNRLTNTFNTEVSITNISPNDLNGPLLLVISNLTPTTVTVANQAGTDPSGNPYIYVLVPAGNISPGKAVSNILLKFNNPNRQVFTFALSVSTVEVLPEPLPADVSGPLITSLAPTAALVGKLLKYQPMTSSNNPTSLAFSLSSSPLGMTIDSGTGLLEWTPAENQVGDQSVTIVAQDSGGQTSQSFTLSCFGARQVASVAISAATGGLITVNDPTSNINGLTINIPAGALSANTTIVVSQLITPPTFGGASRFLMKGFTVDPDGTALSAPATIKIPYSLTEFSSTEGIALEDFLGVYFLQTSTGIPQSLSSFLPDKVNHVLSGTVSHFSTYLSTNIARLCAPLTMQPACPGPMVTSTTPPSLLLPVVFVHGFQAGLPLFTLGDESTWGNLRTLLSRLDSGKEGRIDAWRFDWDSAYTSFERSAANLSTALSQVESAQSSPTPHLVNIVAHSFGGLLTRTYLENMANPGLLGVLEGQGTVGNLAGIPYRNDVNRVMTLGTPHQGIGIGFSTLFATACAITASTSPILQPYTCYEADSSGPFFIAPGTGFFARSLNAVPIPALQSTLTPQYDVIIGQRIGQCIAGVVFCSLQADDGLITTAGNQLCGGSLVNPVNVCAGLQESVVTEINPNVKAPSGLCHSGALLHKTCGTIFGGNIAMAEVNDNTHPLWDEICHYVGCKPAINVTLSDPSAGTVTSDPKGFNCGTSCNPPGIDCGSNCTALLEKGTTVTLTATPVAGGSFSGWSGACTGTAPTCVLTIVDDDDHLKSGYQVTATFNAVLLVSNFFSQAYAITSITGVQAVENFVIKPAGALSFSASPSATSVDLNVAPQIGTTCSATGTVTTSVVETTTNGQVGTTVRGQVTGFGIISPVHDQGAYGFSDLCEGGGNIRLAFTLAKPASYNLTGAFTGDGPKVVYTDKSYNLFGADNNISYIMLCPAAGCYPPGYPPPVIITLYHVGLGPFSSTGFLPAGNYFVNVAFGGGVGQFNDGTEAVSGNSTIQFTLEITP